MAFSGNPITHSLSVTAFGGSARSGDRTESAGKKRRIKDDDPDRVIKEAGVPKHLQKRRVLAKDPIDSDNDDSDIGEPTSRWSPTRGLVSLASAASATAANPVSADPKKSKKQKTTAAKMEQQGDLSMSGLVNETEEREIVEISSDEEEGDDHQSDVANTNTGKPHDHQSTPSIITSTVKNANQDTARVGVFANNSGPVIIPPANRAPDQPAASPLVKRGKSHRSVPKPDFSKESDIMEKDAKESMKVLVPQLQQALFGRVYSASSAGMYETWFAAIQKLDSLTGSHMHETVVTAAPKSRITVARDLLLQHFASTNRNVFGKDKRKQFLQDNINLRRLVKLLLWVCDQNPEPGMGGPATTTPADQEAPGAQDDRFGVHSDETFIRELKVSSSAPSERPGSAAQEPTAESLRRASQTRVSTGAVTPTVQGLSSDTDRVASTEQVSMPKGGHGSSISQSTAARSIQLATSHINRGVWQRVQGTGVGSAASWQLLDRNTAASPAVDVDTIVGTLKSEISKATKKNVDWNNIPVALFETEMLLKSLVAALDKAKDALAKSDGA